MRLHYCQHTTDVAVRTACRSMFRLHASQRSRRSCRTSTAICWPAMQFPHRDNVLTAFYKLARDQYWQVTCCIWHDCHSFWSCLLGLLANEAVGTRLYRNVGIHLLLDTTQRARSLAASSSRFKKTNDSKNFVTCRLRFVSYIWTYFSNFIKTASVRIK